MKERMLAKIKGHLEKLPFCEIDSWGLDPTFVIKRGTFIYGFVNIKCVEVNKGN